MKILIATDSSQHANAAVEFVRHLTLPQAAVTVLSVAQVESMVMPGAAGYVLPETSLNWYEIARDAAEKEASGCGAAAAAKLERVGWKVTPLARIGHPTEVILETAAKQDSDLIVVGSRGLGRLTGWLLGSVSHALAHSAPCSVCVVRPQPREDERGVWQQLLLATDGSDDAEIAAQTMLDLHLNEHAIVNVLNVLPDFAASPGMREDVARTMEESRRREARELVDGVAAKLRNRFTAVSAQVREGDAGYEIIEAAQQNRTDLIIVGTRGLAGLKHLLLGSVAQKVASYAPCSVLVVKRRPVAAAAESAT